MSSIHFFFNDTATTEIYTLSLHDALPISTLGSNPRAASLPTGEVRQCSRVRFESICMPYPLTRSTREHCRSEEHTSELQSHLNLVCRLLLEKKNKYIRYVRVLRSQHSLQI